MSCQKCEDDPILGAFLRWKNANIEIIACEEHWKEIRDVLLEARRKENPYL